MLMEAAGFQMKIWKCINVDRPATKLHNPYLLSSREMILGKAQGLGFALLLQETAENNCWPKGK